MATYNHATEEEPRELIQGMLHDAREMASAEVDKLKAEAKEVSGSAKIAGVGLAAIVVAALLFGQALAFVLVALGLPAWAGFLITAIVMGGVGAAIVIDMKKRAIEAVKAV
ncbi:MAG: hypothetical protein JWO36_78 [Myxococcales bacterium]|nr:hypothetical protein [Myxococcales bacterium]